MSALGKSRVRGVSTYLRNGCGENNHLVKLAYPLHELVDSRALDDVDIVVVALDLHWYREIRLVEDLI